MDEYEFEEPPEEPHEFEIDVRNVVLTNLDMVLDGIARAHTTAVERFHPPDNGVNQQWYVDWIGSKYDGLRKAAINLALVGLVTRFHHWLICLANSMRADKDRTFDRSVAQELHFLNLAFKDPPHKHLDFKKWIDVRDSIIHADSKASWMHGRTPMKIDRQFVYLDELNFTQTDLNDAFQHMLSAIAWYMDGVDEWLERKYGPRITFNGVPARRAKRDLLS